MSADRRYLHARPEVGFELPQTTAYVKKRLDEMGVSFTEMGQCGIIADLGGKNGGKTILIREDMDALPMRELTEEPFKSDNGYMHACGHDIHTAMLLCVAQVLKQEEDSLPGRVRLMFQPAEESVSGARMMVEHGVLSGVDAALAIHVGIGEKTGKVITLKGPAATSSDVFRITIKGKGGHGSTPYLTVDPITVGSHLVLNLQAIIAREIDALENVVLTIGKFSSGDVYNIIPETAILEGTLRAFKPEQRAFAKQRLVDMTQQTAALFRAQADLEFLSETPPIYNDGQLADITVGAIRAELGDELCDFSAARIMASDDFAYLSERVPGVMFYLGAGSEEEGYTVGVHNPLVVFNEECMPYGAAALCAAVIGWLAEEKKER